MREFGDGNGIDEPRHALAQRLRPFLHLRRRELRQRQCARDDLAAKLIDRLADIVNGLNLLLVEPGRVPLVRGDVRFKRKLVAVDLGSAADTVSAKDGLPVARTFFGDVLSDGRAFFLVVRRLPVVGVQILQHRLRGDWHVRAWDRRLALVVVLPRAAERLDALLLLDALRERCHRRVTAPVTAAAVILRGDGWDLCLQRLQLPRQIPQRVAVQVPQADRLLETRDLGVEVYGCGGWTRLRWSAARQPWHGWR